MGLHYYKKEVNMGRRINISYEDHPFGSEEKWLEQCKISLRLNGWDYFCTVYGPEGIIKVVGLERTSSVPELN